MADNIKSPLKFDGLNFAIWKVKMTVFLQSLGSHVANRDQAFFFRRWWEHLVWYCR